jgi:hypothetical protein
MMLDDLDMTGSDAHKDFRAVLSYFPLAALERLRTAQEKNLLIRNRYHDSDGRGCVMFFLGDITSKPMLLAYPFGDEELLLAARRLVRHWDASTLSASDLRTILAETIARRIEANEQEDAAVRAAQALVETKV